MPPDPVDLGQARAAVVSVLDAMLAGASTAGLQYLCLRGGKTLLEQVAGQADVRLGVPVAPATTFNIYSITKPVMAAAVLALAETGALDLEQPVGDAAGVPGLEPFGSVRDTLLHRAGFPNPNPLRWVHAAEVHERFQEAAFVQDRVAGLQGHKRRLMRAGYSNLGYMVLGLAVARASGMPFDAFIEQQLLSRPQRAAGESLSFSIPEPSRHAHGSLRRRSLLNLVLGLLIERSAIVEWAGPRWIQLRLHHVNGSAYGGLMANARGLARFGQAVLGQRDGLSPDVRRGLLEVVPGPGPRRSLGWFAGTLDGLDWLAHAGGGLGYYSELRLYPSLGVVSVLLLNRPGLRDARLLDRIDRPLIASLRAHRH